MTSEPGSTGKQWAQMTAEQKLSHRLDRWLNAPIEFADEAAEHFGPAIRPEK